MDIPKHLATDSGGNLFTDIKNLFSVLRTRKTMVFAYGFMFTFVCFTVFFAFSPSSTSSSPGFKDIFSSSSSTGSGFRSQVSSIYSYFFPNSSQPISQIIPKSIRSDFNTSSVGNQTPTKPKLNQTVHVPPPPPSSAVKTSSSSPVAKNETAVKKSSPEQNIVSNSTASLSKQNNGATPTSINVTKSSSTNQTPPKSDNPKKISKGLLNSLMHCNLFDGGWVIDDSYPLYSPGSCPHIDESFNCFVNGRPDKDFQKLRWKPKDCDLPRLNGKHMLELLRGKRLAFVGDSLNRNMWESLICILRNSVADKSKVFEVSGRHEFRTEGFYSFVFQEYNCSVEFIRSPFLVQEWEMHDTNGTTKETLRLDLVERSSSKYKDADILVFNTGHWWTHEKTSKGKGYYQVGNHVFGTLNPDEAFHKALSTWAKWVDVNVNPNNTLVSFRGYSASHFSGGHWNSGGSCDNETEPIKKEKYLSAYELKMRIFESVMNEMKTPVFYLNITRMTDYRKDAHPSIYRKKNLSAEERKSSLRYQDCSHWCLPGVPDIWNELLYTEILIHQNRKLHEQKLQKQQQQQLAQEQKKP